MRFDLVVNTFVKDALVEERLLLHGGGWMWRPLVDVRDAADAMIACYEAPDHLVRGEIFNVLHSNYQIRELAMLVAGSAQLVGCTVRLEEAPAQAHPRLRVLEREALGSAGIHSPPVGGRGGRRPAERRRPQRSVEAHRSSLLQHPLAPAAARGKAAHRGVRLGLVSLRRVLITGGGGQLASDLEELLAGRRRDVGLAEELDVTDDDAVRATSTKAA